MGSTTPISQIADEDLENELEITYGDLEYVAARIVALFQRLHPEEHGLNALVHGVTQHVNRESDKIIAQAETV